MIGAAFVDVGMGLELVDGSLGGILRVTASTPDKRDHIGNRVSFTGGGAEDIYSSNIQVAESERAQCDARRGQVEEVARVLPRY